MNKFYNKKQYVSKLINIIIVSVLIFVLKSWSERWSVTRKKLLGVVRGRKGKESLQRFQGVLRLPDVNPVRLLRELVSPRRDTEF